MTQELSREELDMFSRTIDRIAVARYPRGPHHMSIAGNAPIDLSVWADYAQAGVLGLLMPSSFGLTGTCAVELTAVFERIGRHLLPEPFIATILAGRLLEMAAGSEVIGSLIAAAVDGRAFLALADGGRGDPSRLPTVSGDHGTYRLNGTVRLALDGVSADNLIVRASYRGGDALFLAPTSGDGVSGNHRSMMDGHYASAFTFADVSLASDSRLELDDATSAMNRIYDLATLAASAEILGIAERLNQATLDYLGTRKQFGVHLESFQALRHRIVDMFIAHRQAAAMLRRAARAVDCSDPDTSRLVSAAKILVARAGRLIGEEAIQLHGGIGMTDELFVGQGFKRILNLNSLFGDVEWHLLRMAQSRAAIG